MKYAVLLKLQVKNYENALFNTLLVLVFVFINVIYTYVYFSDDKEEKPTEEIKREPGP